MTLTEEIQSGGQPGTGGTWLVGEGAGGKLESGPGEGLRLELEQQQDHKPKQQQEQRKEL